MTPSGSEPKLKNKGPDMKSLWIVGGGWAGLSAAVRAKQRGYEVTLIEAKRELGGRARSVQLGPHTLDNGQHILISAYENTLNLMKEVGLNPLHVLRRERLSLCTQTGEGFELLAGSRWPMVANLFLSTLLCKGWSLADKYSFLKTTTRWASMGFACAKNLSVEDICSGMSRLVMQTLISPLCLSAMNTPIEMSSGSVFLKVLRDALFQKQGGSDFLLPTCDLGELLPHACERWLHQNRVKIFKGRRLSDLGLALDLEKHQQEAAISEYGPKPDAVVLACDAKAAAKLTQGINPSWSKQVEQLEFTAIATTYICVKDPNFRGLVRNAKRQAFLRLNDQAPPKVSSSKSGEIQTPQFVFDRGFLMQNHPTTHAVQSNQTVLSFVTSFATSNNEALSSAAMNIAREQLGLKDLELLGTITERAAALCCSPGLERPPQRVSDQLWACGDYVQGPYPSTLEGAVMSAVKVVDELVTG